MSFSAYIELGAGFNIFALDWTDLNGAHCCYLDYCGAAYNVPDAGRRLATLMLHIEDQLMKERRGKFVLVGHSLGCHICGFASRTFKDNKHGIQETETKRTQIEIHGKL